MSIKVRLIMSTATLLCLATGVIGTIAISAVTTAMTDRVDSQLRHYLRQPQVTHQTTLAANGTTSAPESASAYQAVAVLIVSEDGKVAVFSTAGYYTDPLPLPVPPSELPAEGEFGYATSADGSTAYRIMSAGTITATAGEQSIQGRLVLAAPLTEVNAIRDKLIVTMIVTVLAVLLLSVLASWWITRRGLRPVDNMIDTAAAIADGDLTRRAARDKGELGRLAGALNTMVSRLVHAIAERQTQQDKLRRFVSDASHELRTPLATITGYADLYRSGGAPPGPVLDQAMSRIRSEGLRMGGLVDDMLTLARLDRAVPSTYAACDLSAVVRAAVDAARTTDGSRPIEVSAEEPVLVRGDETELHQAIGHLLANTRQHTPEGTSVTVSLVRDENRAILTVSDDGPGIAEEHRPRVFDRFYRVDPSRSRATGGSGLGLSIVATVVTMHGGTVAIDNTVAEGTVVRVELPAIQIPEEPHLRAELPAIQDAQEAPTAIPPDRT